MQNELKPCPFCGEEVKIVFSPYGRIYMVACSKCGAIVSFKGNEGKSDVRYAWNRRVDNEI